MGTEIELHLGNCLEMRDFILPCHSPSKIVIVTDPPYGMKLKTNYRSRKRGALAECNDFEAIIGDDSPFDPSPWLEYSGAVLFGANWYADKLPVSGGWIVWDKLDGLQSKRELGFNDNSDCELIWTNIRGVTRIIRHRWMGCMKGSEHRERRVHPTQKPIALMQMIIRHYTNHEDIVVDPFMGSGSTGVACVREGRYFIGIEIVRKYFDIAVERIAQARLEMELL